MRKNCCEYPVVVASDVFGESDALAEVLRKASGSDAPRVQIVADLNVVQRTEGLGQRIGRYVQDHGIVLAGSPVVVPAGEKLKIDGVKGVHRISTALVEARLAKNDIVLAIGGGTLLDVAGYVAAQARGGVGIVRMPTTPAAMMDAAFANYAALDMPMVKDALRVPSVPAAVVVDPTFCTTVLDGVWRGGASEAVKIAAAHDKSLFKKLVSLAAAYRNRDSGALSEVVAGVMSVRTSNGATTIGEWSALRLESMSGYKLPHGYAMAMGICIDAAYSVEKGYMKEEDAEKIGTLLGELGSLDGVMHSRHLLGRVDSLMRGLDAWNLANGTPDIMVPAGIGKTVIDKEPDRDAYAAALAKLTASPLQDEQQ